MITIHKDVNYERGIIKIKGYTKKMIPTIFDEMEDTAIRIRNHMVKAMDRTPRSGKPYKRGGVTDHRSLPGKAPAPDSGDLKKSLKVNVRRVALQVEVGSNLRARDGGKPYSVYLEEGTVKMKARPYLEPAAASATKNMERRIERALKRIR
jgi:hypothetical protein